MKLTLLKLSFYVDALLMGPSAFGCIALLNHAGTGLEYSLGKNSVPTVACIVLLVLLFLAVHTLFTALVAENSMRYLQHSGGREYGNRCGWWHDLFDILSLIGVIAIMAIYVIQMIKYQQADTLELCCIFAAIAKLLLMVAQPVLVAKLRREEAERCRALYGARIF